VTMPGSGLLAPRVYYRWRKLRRRVLDGELWCRPCRELGRKTRAVEVDHIMPLAKGGDVLSEKNCQPICKVCHIEKTNSEFKKTGVDDEGVPLWRRRMPEGMPV